MKSLCSILAAITISISAGIDLRVPAELTAEQLEEGLLYELKPLAPTFVEIEKVYGINSVAYSSIVAIESGWGRSKMSQSKNNITSFRCGREFRIYHTKAECLWDMAKNLSKNYLSKDGIYYSGGTKLNDIAGFYLIGKSPTTPSEKKAVSEYVETISEISNGIVRRIKAGEN